MKVSPRSLVPSVALLFVVALAGPALGGATKEEAEADEKWLLDTWEKHKKVLDTNSPLAPWHQRLQGTTQPLPDPWTQRQGFKETLDQLDAMVADLAAIKERIAAIEKRYDDPKVNIPTLIARAKAPEKKPKNVSGSIHVDAAYKGLKSAPEKLEKRRTEVADSIVKHVDDFMKDLPYVSAKRITAALELALRIKPTDALKTRVANLQAELAKHRTDNAKRLDEKPVPDHLKSFAGPGKADDLAKAALDFLKNPENATRVGADNLRVIDFEQGEWRYHGAWVKEDWYVAEKDALGKPTRWGMVLCVAIADPEMEAADVVGVYDFTFLCAPHAEKATAWVRTLRRGDNGTLPHTYVRLSAVKKK